MGQIIFPTTLDWSLGSRSQVVNVGTYLRLEFLNETYGTRHDTLNSLASGVVYNGIPCWDLSVDTNWHTIVMEGSACIVAYLLWDGASIGGGFRIYENDNRNSLVVTRDATTFNGETIDDTTPIWGGSYGYYSSGDDHQKLWTMTPHIANYEGHVQNYEHSVYKTYFMIRYCYVIAASTGYTNYALYDDVLNMRFKPTGYWLSPIIDMGPYIHITLLSVTNYSIPTGGSVKIYFRTSGSAPTTGSPTAFEDTSGNTLYYYPADAEWSASDWEEVPSGSEPSYKDRYIQMKLELNGA